MITMGKSMRIFAGGLLCVAAWSQTPNCTITAPAASATISGTNYKISGSITSAPSAHSVTVNIDGDDQGIIWLSQSGQSNWSIQWNTNWRNDTPAALLTATVKDALGATVAACTQSFSISNQFRTAATTILSGVAVSNGSGGTCSTSSFSRNCVLTATITGSNASTSKAIEVMVGGAVVYTAQSVTSTSPAANIKSALFPNGAQWVCFYMRPTDISSGGIQGPGGEWCQYITFSNSNAASEIEITSSSPSGAAREWLIAPSATYQLGCLIRNADSTTQACSGALAVTWDTVNYVGGSHSTANCSVNSSGLVTAGSGAQVCIVTAAVSGLATRTFYGWMSSSNTIPHYGSDGQIHTDQTNPWWMASMFGGDGNSQFCNAMLTQAGYLSPYVLNGYNTIEAGPASPLQSTQSAFVTYLHNVLATSCGASAGHGLR